MSTSFCLPESYALAHVPSLPFPAIICRERGSTHPHAGHRVRDRPTPLYIESSGFLVDVFLFLSLYSYIYLPLPKLFKSC